MANENIKVPSPCVGVCALDKHDICIACQRTGIEIAEWGVYTVEEKLTVMEKVKRREQGDLVE